MTANPSVTIRFSEEERFLAQEAARISGTNKWTTWVRQTALQKARKLVEEEEKITLSNHDRDTFLNALENPPKPNENLKNAVSKYLKSKNK